MRVPDSLHSCVRRIGGGRAERRNLLSLYLYMWCSQAVIQMFQLVTAECINQGSLDLHICLQRNPKKGKKGGFSALPCSVLVSDASSVM